MLEHINIKKASFQQKELLEDDELLSVRTVNQCINDAKTRPIPKMLFSEFWHEGELCILFADTNSGKSILAVQIANCISNGEVMRGFFFEAAKQPVIYADFEMSDKQFEKRYSLDYASHYQFDDNFYRIVINPDCSNFDDFENQLFISLEKTIKETNSKVLIIDNITYLKTQATDTAKEAIPLMKKLNELKKRHDLSILALAHTPKRNRYLPIGKNDLGGSKHLANFADSMFAIGESSIDKNLRYLKQLKARATEIKYDSDNIILCGLSKPLNFLRFDFIDFATENEHLRQRTDEETNETTAKIIELKSSNPGYSGYKIAQELGINRMTVKRVLDKNGLSNS